MYILRFLAFGLGFFGFRSVKFVSGTFKDGVVEVGEWYNGAQHPKVSGAVLLSRIQEQVTRNGVLYPCLAKLGIKAIVVDSNLAADHEKGRGDALQCRTIEVMRNLGVANAMIDEGAKMFVRSFWVGNFVWAVFAADSIYVFR